MTGYRNIEDLPGDPTESEFGLAVVRSEHAVSPFDDVAIIGNEAALLSAGELRGTLNLEALALLGGRA